jgi:hypothetical protein
MPTASAPGVGVMVIAGSTVRGKFTAGDATLLASVADTAMVYAPAALAAGVPLITPVPLLMVNPAGRLLAVALHAMAGVPPVSVMILEPLTTLV